MFSVVFVVMDIAHLPYFYDTLNILFQTVILIFNILLYK